MRPTRSATTPPTRATCERAPTSTAGCSGNRRTGLDAQAAQFHKLAGILDQRLDGRQWVAGNGLTIADIVLAAPMHLHGWQKLPLSDHPNLKRWITGGVEKLPCWQKTAVYEGFTTTQPN